MPSKESGTRQRVPFRRQRLAFALRAKVAALTASVLATAALAGCGVGPAERDPDEPTGTLSREILNQVEIGDYSISFERIPGPDGDDSIMLAETVRSTDLLAALTREHGMLTSLETFLAFAPAGSEPHPDLVAAHEAEASVLGRSGDSLALQVVDFESLSVEKNRPLECNGGVSANLSPFTASERTSNPITIDGLDIFTCLGDPLISGNSTTPTGCELFHPNRLMRMSACNGTASDNDITVFVTATGVLSLGPDTVPRGSFKRYTIQPNPPPPGGAIQRRKMALRSKNQIPPIQPGNTHYHVGVLGIP